MNFSVFIVAKHFFNVYYSEVQNKNVKNGVKNNGVFKIIV